MKLFRRASEPEPERPSARFGEWLLRQFSGGRPTGSLPYADIERICANAGSLLMAAVYARPAAFGHHQMDAPETAREAAVLSQRTADGFKASLADRENTVIAWPWDHLATQVAWEASRENDTSEAALATALMDVGCAYALRHREQVTAVLDLWGQVAKAVRHTEQRTNLKEMGEEMLNAFEATVGGPP